MQEVHAGYGATPILFGVSLEVREGEAVALLGRNGMGKTTLMKTIIGFLKPWRGAIEFEDRDLTRLAPHEIARLGVGLVPENRRIFPGLTVRENIMLGASSRGRLPRSQMEEEVAQMFEIFPVIKPFENALGWTLSGGQQQMLAVARGLMAKPKLLLLDEPSLGLAPVIVQQLFGTIREIHARGTTIMLVEQNANMALSVANRGYVLETGEMKVEGTPKELLGNEEVRAAYLGGHG
jgi:branched-chain amino acid transport system ATP-binding protein